MVGRVATFALSDSMIAAALRAQSELAKRQVQEASGKVSSDYAGYGADAKKVIDLQVSIARSKTYEAAATSADNRVQVMYSATGSIVDLLSSFKSKLTAASSASGTDEASLKSTAQSFMEEMASLLNTQYGGRYLFAGTRTETLPVDFSLYSNTTSSSVADTSYYGGDAQIESVRIAASQSIAYGVTGDNSAFEQAMRAVSMLANASTIDATAISDALDLATTALDNVTAIQTELSLVSSRLERAVSVQQDVQSFLGSVSSDLTDVDVAAVAAEISTYQSQLEASYSAIAKVQSLSLASYLR